MKLLFLISAMLLFVLAVAIPPPPIPLDKEGCFCGIVEGPPVCSETGKTYVDLCHLVCYVEILKHEGPCKTD